MSYVAETKAPAQNAARDRKKNDWLLSENATANRQRLIAAWLTTIQRRLVEYTSTKGPQNILTTHGRYSQLVQKAILALSMPMRLNRMTDTVLISTYGRPSPK